MIRHARRSGALARNFELALGQGDAEHVDARDLVQEERHPAPAAADVENALAGLERELGGDMRLLVELGLLEAVLRVGEVGAAVLLVLVEEEFVELVAKVVVVRDVLARALQIVGVERLEQAFPALASTASCGPCPNPPSDWRRRSSA